MTVGRERLREATLRGVRATVGARVGVELVRLAGIVVLARLIPPSEFGLAVLAYVVVGVAGGLATETVAVPLVRREGVGRAERETALLMSLLIGGALALATVLLAPLVVPAVFHERVTPLVQLSALAFLLGGLGATGSAELQRRFEFGRLGSIEVASLTIGTIAAIVLAVAGLDARALILGWLVEAAVSAALLAPAARVLPRWHRAAGRELVGLGGTSTLAGLTAATSRQVDKAILGAQLTATDLGLYHRAFQFGVEYQNKVSAVTMRLALPVYSRATDLDDLRRLRRRVMRVQSSIVLPLLGLFIVVAPVLVPFALGSRWEPAVLPAQILAVAGMANAVKFGTGPLMFAVGRPGALLALNLGFLLSYAVTLLLLAPSGLVAVCIGSATLFVAQTLASHYLLLGRIVGMPVRELVGDVVPALASTGALMAAAAFVAWTSDTTLGAPTGVTTLLSVAFGAAACLLCLRTSFPAAWQDIALVVGRTIGGRRVLAAK